MNPTVFIYLSDVVGNLNAALIALMVISAIAFIASGIIWGIGSDINDEDIIYRSIKCLKVSIISFVSFMIVSIPIPSEKTIYLMGASEVIQSVAKNDKVGKIADKSIELLEKKIEEYTKEATK